MAQRTGIGGAKKVTQISTITVGGTISGEDFIISAANPSGVGSAVQIASVTDGDGSATTNAAALVAAWNASNHPYAQAVTASNVAGVIMFTADKAGIPFILSVNTPGGSATFVLATTTANCGPDCYIAENFAEGVLPDAASDVVITGDWNVLYNLDQSGVELDNFARHNHRGRIGWPGMPLKIDLKNTAAGVGKLIIDCPMGDVAYISFGTAAISPTIIHAGSAYPIALYLTGSAGVGCTIYSGNIGLAWNEGDSMVFSGVVNNVGNARVHMGPGFNGNKYYQTYGGWGHCKSDNTIALIELADGGDFIEQAVGAITSFVNNGTQAVMLGTGAIAGGSCVGGFSDFTGAVADRSVTLSYLVGKAAFASVITTGTRTLLGKPAPDTGS